MTQQTVFRPIQEYRSKAFDKTIIARNFSGQGLNVCETTFATGIAVTNQGSINVTSSVWNVSPNVGQTTIWQTFTQFLLNLDHVTIDGKAVQLTKPVAVNAYFQDNMYFCQNEELGIVSVSANMKDCIRDFEDEFWCLWNEYGKEPDDRLTDNAKVLKKRLLQHLKMAK